MAKTKENKECFSDFFNSNSFMRMTSNSEKTLLMKWWSKKSEGGFSRHVVITAISTGIISAFLVLLILHLTSPQPNINITLLPGTAYENQSFWYNNFNIRIVNNGTGEANYLSFLVTTPANMINGTINYGIFMRSNISIKYAASSCDAESINDNLTVVALSNFGPKQRCDINISIYHLDPQIATTINYTAKNGEYLGSYTSFDEFYNFNWLGLFRIINVTSDSNYKEFVASCPPEGPVVAYNVPLIENKNNTGVFHSSTTTFLSNLGIPIIIPNMTLKGNPKTSAKLYCR